MTSKTEKQKQCPICGKKLTFLKETLKDGIKVCSKHVSVEAGLLMKDEIRQSTVEDIKERIKQVETKITEKSNEVKSFSTSKQIGNFVAFDEESRKWATLSTFGGIVQQIYDYDSITDFELLEDGDSVASGGLGRALVGGVLFGGAGAVVGVATGRKTKEYCSSLRLKVTIKDISNPIVYINFIESRVGKSENTYKEAMELAHECLSTFQLICEK